MLSKSLKQLVMCRLREFRREPSAMIFVISMPIIWMLILGLAFSDRKMERYYVGFVSPSVANPSVETMLGSLSREEILLMQGTENELAAKLKSGQILLMIRPDATQVSYYYDATNPMAQRARDFCDRLIQTAFGQKPAVDHHDVLLTQHGSRYIDFLIPGLMALSLFTTSLFGTGMTIVVNRRENLLKRYRATPMNPYEYLVSHVLGRLLVMFLELGSILLAGYLVFSFRMVGSVGLFLIVSALSTVCFASLAILCGSRLANTSTYNGISNLIILLMMLFSGIWFSKANFGETLAWLSSYLPLSASVDALRLICLDGGRFGDVKIQIVTLTIYTIVSLILANRLFVWQARA